MWNHEPDRYDCPFCRLLRGAYDERNAATDIVLREGGATARIAPKWWPANEGAVLVIPDSHVENLYDISPEEGHAVWDMTRRVAIAMRNSYDCQGISTRQHNEPAGNQDVWHLHVHVFPRYVGDNLYGRHDEVRWASIGERASYAARLRAALEAPSSGRPVDNFGG
ncbi:HIT family protein [Luteipulveratus mongoliensis]|uniref:Diadenosine tetraphosphate hydrolase n=1 Tax=Luteipulveratus mongoliensis TaxID=571913 RepID=A0A0K1JIC4_9MICO|nr:HIT domain-containing protein [Luteipulveratus mongoliensis]AKU16472.1 diadenosine tetraphosphate hydrolase [Luteipulveratus mongoliensis]